MTVISYISILVLVCGAVLYLATKHEKAAELGRIAFFVGLLWAVYATMHHVIRLG